MRTNFNATPEQISADNQRLDAILATMQEYSDRLDAFSADTDVPDAECAGSLREVAAELHEMVTQGSAFSAFESLWGESMGEMLRVQIASHSRYCVHIANALETSSNEAYELAQGEKRLATATADLYSATMHAATEMLKAVA